MTTLLFKTRKLAKAYINENYPQVKSGEYSLRDTYITEESNWDDVDMPNLQWSGETPAYSIEDDNFDEVARVAWWEEGDDEYKLFVGHELKGEFDNSYDAREAQKKAQEEETIFEVKLFCNGEDITE